MLTSSERTAFTQRNDPPSQRVSAPAGRVTPTAVDRLRQVLESAPAAVIVTSPDGAVLAANTEALGLLGVDELDRLLGTAIADRVADDDRDRFRRFTSDVCEGRAGTLEYRLAPVNGLVRSVETRAVALSRDQGARNVFLSVTWNITDRKRAADTGIREMQARVQLLDAQLLAQREAFEAALQEARAATDGLKQTMADTRKALAASVRRARERSHTKLAEARDSRERQVAENDRLATALDDVRARLSSVDEERNEERAQRHALLDQRERWRVKLSEVLEAMSQSPGPGSASLVRTEPDAPADDSQWEF